MSKLIAKQQLARVKDILAKHKKKSSRSFFFHYNKPLSKRLGRNVLSIHYKNACYFVESLACSVAIATRHRKTQPRCVIAGKALGIEFEGDASQGVYQKATIY